MGVYWIINSVIGIVRDVILNRIFKKQLDADRCRTPCRPETPREAELEKSGRSPNASVSKTPPFRIRNTAKENAGHAEAKGRESAGPKRKGSSAQSAVPDWG